MAEPLFMSLAEWQHMLEHGVPDDPPEWFQYQLQALLYKKATYVGTVLPSSTCHYCGDKATTEDHIVPRCDLPKPMSRVPYWFRSTNVVPACGPCNNRKGACRSDCECNHCRWAWVTAKACFLPEGYQERGLVYIVRSPG